MAEFPKADVTVVAKGTPPSHVWTWKKRFTISRNKWEGNKPAVEKEWNQMKLNSNSRMKSGFRNFDKVEIVSQKSKSFEK